jgi:hypothetical protein
MEKLNWQSENKIKNIKTAIENNEDLKEIIKKYWGSKNKKDLWLDKFKDNFNSAELTYLDYTVENIEINLSNLVSNLETQETNKITKLDKVETDTNLALPNEFNFFKDKDNLKTLIEIVTKYKNNKDMQVIEAGKIDIPDEIKQIELNGNIAVKSNLQLYDKIKEMAYSNHIGIGQFITFILWDFYKRHN